MRAPPAALGTSRLRSEEPAATYEMTEEEKKREQEKQEVSLHIPYLCCQEDTWSFQAPVCLAHALIAAHRPCSAQRKRRRPRRGSLSEWVVTEVRTPN